MAITNLKMLAGVSAIALSFGAQAAAQEASENVEALVVTGSRIVRDGYQAPTPVTVIGMTQLTTMAPANVADAVVRLPSLVNSATAQNGMTSVSNGQGGVIALNLRGLGTVRTLTLLDGQRVAPSTATGLVDINSLPQGLISRVDVVTGGASAAYGSDALSGVVNFVLDKKFTGIKGEVSGGITSYGDDASRKFTLTAGRDFAGGRGHVLFDAEYNQIDGIYGIPRKWQQTGRYSVPNPAYTATNGQPATLIVSGGGFMTANYGGIITQGPLKGTVFGNGGSVGQFNYGTFQSDPISVGGDWALPTSQGLASSLDQYQKRQNYYTRVSFDLTPDIELFGEASYAEANTDFWDIATANYNNINVPVSNPYVPASVVQRAQAAGVTSFVMGHFYADLPPIAVNATRQARRFVGGLNGRFDALGTTWRWNAYEQYGKTLSDENVNGYQRSRMTLALDSVVNNGQIVCRSTLTNPSNGCVPFNLFGIGVNSAAAVNYVLGGDSHSHRQQEFSENVMAASIRGEPLKGWAGPISVAAGIERRTEKLTGAVDPASAASDWYIGNYKASFGKYSVTEGFLETLIPLAKDASFAKSLDLNGAVRATDYSTSGYVTTWKLGATYVPVDGLRFRVTRSRDIRAPNLNELFAAGTSGIMNLLDRQNGGRTVNIQAVTTGNPNLTPEIASTLGAGVIVQPTFLKGFSASFDYYNIKIKGGVGSLSAQQIADNCTAGQTVFCSAVTRTNGVLSQVLVVPFNVASQTARGFDIEVSQTIDLEDVSDKLSGSLNLRGLATHYIKNYFNNGLTPAYDTVGINAGLGSTSGQPNWAYQAEAVYQNGPFTMAFTGRGVSSGIYSVNNYPTIACTSGCPTSTTAAPTINENKVPGAFYLDGAARLKFASHYEVFLSIRNMFNRNPPVLAANPLLRNTIQSNAYLYDTLGRVYRAGIKFNF